MRLWAAQIVIVAGCLLSETLTGVDASTIRVPDDQPTIAAGIAAASIGDTVLVACGIYREYAIELKSGVCLLSESGFPECATIDADSQGRVLFGEGLASSTRIEGFTITKGLAAVPGGGLYCGDGSSPTVLRCLFLENYGSLGGGAAASGSDLTLVGCNFEGNVASFSGGALHLSGGAGASLIECTFTHSGIAQAGGGWGGAIYCEESPGISLTRCRFSNNITVGIGPGDRGGAVYLRDTAADLANCTFALNQARSGGALYCDIGASAVLSNSILANNGYDGAIICAAGGSAQLSCCDVALNQGGDWLGCLEGQEGAQGNFSTDPRFCNPEEGDFALAANSPCLPGNHPQGVECGLIGAHREGCPPNVVEPTTWGAIKASFQ